MNTMSERRFRFRVSFSLSRGWRPTLVGICIVAAWAIGRHGWSDWLIVLPILVAATTVRLTPPATGL